MPIYEFRCKSCKEKFSDLLPANSEGTLVNCPNCQSSEVTKLVSKFTRAKSEDDRLDTIADKLDAFGEPDSQNQMRKMVREMGRAMDDDCADDMEEMFEADMEGNLPEDD